MLKKIIEGLSVIIPSKDDPAVTKCVDSIDFPAHAIIVFNGSTQEFIEQVTSALGQRAEYQILPEPNLALALETGIRNSPTDWVILMDSDCEFEKGAIKSFYETMLAGNPSCEVYKGQVIFRQGTNVMSKIIAKSRQHHTAEELTAYKPPLALSREIGPKIGGHFFNPELIWREDADLDNRIREANIAILPVDGGTIYHGQLNIKSDLRSTFRYGVGEAIADSLGIKLTDVPRSVQSTFKSQGALPALYMLFRNRVYTAGYLFKKMNILLLP